MVSVAAAAFKMPNPVHIGSNHCLIISILTKKAAGMTHGLVCVSGEMVGRQQKRP
jgi:hypothetical protein